MATEEKCPYSGRGVGRRGFLAGGVAAVGAALVPQPFAVAAARRGKLGVMLMNRIGPSTSTLYIADIDGKNERRLLQNSAFDRHASITADGKTIYFTTERAGDGNSSIYWASLNGSGQGVGVQPSITGSAVDDTGVPSPDGTKLAFMSTRSADHLAQIWVKNLKSEALTNLTGTAALKGGSNSPDGHFRPAWSPDSQWIAFSSDRNTAWTGHGNGTGWEHTQELSIYIIKADGTGFRQVATKPGYCLGSPSWSPDGTRIVYYQLTREDTWAAHRPEDIGQCESQICSVNVATGATTQLTSTANVLKVSPRYVNNTEVGYLIKGGPNEGIAYVNGTLPTVLRAGMRSPIWTPDGKSIIYDVPDADPVRTIDQTLYSWDSDWDYRFMDVFPVLSKQGRLAITQKQTGAAISSIVTMKPDGTDQVTVYNAASDGDPILEAEGLVGAFRPSWSPDGQWLAFGMGGWFQMRATMTAVVYRVKSDGTGLEALTDGSTNAGFPCFSPDGTKLLYRVWGAEDGLRILDLATRTTTALTDWPDNVPDWSDDNVILFTRKTSATSFDICTINPDGTGLKQLTVSGANHAHAVWNGTGRILYNSGDAGFREEAALYDDTFQPYGQIFSMNADGSDNTMLTDSQWEDSMPLYLTNAVLNG